MKKEGGRAPDYVQERTGHTRRSFSHGISHGMTLNSNRSGTSNDPEVFRYTIKNPGFWKEAYIQRESPAWARVGVTKENAAPTPWARDEVYLPESTRPPEPPYRHISSFPFYFASGGGFSTPTAFGDSGCEFSPPTEVILYGR